MSPVRQSIESQPPVTTYEYRSILLGIQTPMPNNIHQHPSTTTTHKIITSLLLFTSNLCSIEVINFSLYQQLFPVVDPPYNTQEDQLSN
jgi:hypothetical protein